MTLHRSVEDLNQLIQQRRILEAFDKYYADDVVMYEDGKDRVGKPFNRANEEAFVGGLKSFDARLIASAVDEETGRALTEWTLEFDHEKWGVVSIRQVAVQQWRDGQIVHEAFYKL